MQLEFIDYVLVSFYVLNILNTEMRKERNVHSPCPQEMNRVGNGRLVNKLISIQCVSVITGTYSIQKKWRLVYSMWNSLALTLSEMGTTERF